LEPNPHVTERRRCRCFSLSTN